MQVWPVLIWSKPFILHIFKKYAEHGPQEILKPNPHAMYEKFIGFLLLSSKFFLETHPFIMKKTYILLECAPKIFCFFI